MRLVVFEKRIVRGTQATRSGLQRVDDPFARRIEDEQAVQTREIPDIDL
jgi:hypothetical protein